MNDMIETGEEDTRSLAHRMCDEFAERWPASPWGVAHNVIEDLNFSDRDLLFCLRAAWQELKDNVETREETAATIELLLAISALDKADRPFPYFSTSAETAADARKAIQLPR